jgi:hypothetical protein
VEQEAVPSKTFSLELVFSFQFLLQQVSLLLLLVSLIREYVPRVLHELRVSFGALPLAYVFFLLQDQLQVLVTRQESELA